jgi:hypothetical protein
MRKSILLFSAAALLGVGLQAQVCDPTVAPTGLVSTYTPGSGALLEWNPVPGSVGVQLRVDLPSGPTINRRIVGPEVDQFFAPDALLSPGTYTWRVQAACSAVPPFAVTPISASSSFTVGGGGSCPATVTDIDGNVYATVQIGRPVLDGGEPEGGALPQWQQSSLRVKQCRLEQHDQRCLCGL